MQRRVETPKDFLDETKNKTGQAFLGESVIKSVRVTDHQSK